MRQLLVPTLLLIPAALLLSVEPVPAPTGPQAEPIRIGGADIKVSNKKELQFTFKPDDKTNYRELWFQAFDGTNWGKWQKFGQSFQKDAPVVWAPPEGHWKVYFRKFYLSGANSGDPSAADFAEKPNAEFIIDRTAPAGEISFPAPKAKLRGGDSYTVTWKVTDTYLRSTPIAIKYSRDGTTFDTVAENLPNSGSFQWTVPGDLTNSGILRIEAMDKATNLGVIDATGLLVDSIKPKGKVTGPAITAKTETILDLDIKDQGGAGLTNARLWVSQDDGLTWVEGPFISDPWKSVTWKAPADGKYRLAIVGTDGAGNITEAPKGQVGDLIIVDTGMPSIILANATGVIDADKAGAARRHFKPGDRVQIPFTVKEPNLLANSVAVYWQNELGSPWVELAKNQATDAAYRFAIPVDAKETKAARVKVTAIDAAGNTGEAVSIETIEVQTKVISDAVDVNL